MIKWLASSVLDVPGTALIAITSGSPTSVHSVALPDTFTSLEVQSNQNTGGAQKLGFFLALLNILHYQPLQLMQFYFNSNWEVRGF